jgi:hypothetical protein
MQLSFNYLNYIVAWETLKIRYKPAKIRTNGVKALFHVFLLHQPSHQDLKAYVQSVASTQPTNHGYHDTVLVSIQARSRYTVTMEGKIDHKPFPSVGELFHFLHGHCTAMY